MAPRPVPRPVSECEPEPLVPQFYAGRSVFITGATGFMGKVLVERLLWTCPQIGRLHLLMRHKKGVAPVNRLQQLCNSQVFDNIREQCPSQLDKLCIVPGDTSLPDLGLSRDSVQQLQEVSVLFHSAATLKFDEPLKTAVEQNVLSVIRIMDLCDMLPNLEAFVHVSTAYSNTECAVVEERVYTPPVPLAQLLALVDALPEDILADITPRYISPKPNTYTFTKSMAESAVSERASRQYPVAIFRPSIVVSSVRHPFPGWVENLNGPSGMIVGVGAGLLHVVTCSATSRADLIPVDIAIDSLIATAWDVATDKPQEVRVYNCSSCGNPLTWGQFKSQMMRGVQEQPFDSPLWYPSGFITQNRLVHKVSEIVLQTAPLHAVAFLAKLCGIKTRVNLGTASDRLRAMSGVLEFFMTHEWTFHTHNLTKLQEKLTTEDNLIYNLDPNSIHWESQIRDFVKGARKYLLKEKDDNIPTAKRNVNRLYILHEALKITIVIFIFRMLRIALPALLQKLRKLSLSRSNTSAVIPIV